MPFSCLPLLLLPRPRCCPWASWAVQKAAPVPHAKPAAIGAAPAPQVLEVLQEVAEDKEAEIAQICRANALEIAAALHDLAAMQRQVAALRQRLGANNAALQARPRTRTLLALCSCGLCCRSLTFCLGAAQPGQPVCYSPAHAEK